MFRLSTRRLTGVALMLLLSLALAACGGETPTATAIPQSTATTAAAAPTTAAAEAAATATTAAAAAPTNTGATGAPTATAAMAAPTATGASGSSGTTGSSPAEQAVANMRALKSYHLDITSDAAGQQATQSADVDVANNKLRFSTDAAGQAVVVLVIGNDSWMSMDGGKTFTSNPAGEQMAQSLQAFVHMWDAAANGGTATVPEGLKDGTPPTEQIDGTETHHYIANTASGSDQGAVEIWITTDTTPLIRQLKSTSTSGGQQLVSTIKWSKFNEDLGITAP